MKRKILESQKRHLEEKGKLTPEEQQRFIAINNELEKADKQDLW